MVLCCARFARKSSDIINPLNQENVLSGLIQTPILKTRLVSRRDLHKFSNGQKLAMIYVSFTKGTLRIVQVFELQTVLQSITELARLRVNWLYK